VNEWFTRNNRFTLGYKYAERYKNLLGKILHRVHFSPEQKKWLPFVETVYEAHFLEDSPLYPYAYSYPYRQIIKSNIASNDVWWVFWSDDYMFYYLPGTDKIRYEETFAPDGTNPFGIMPMVEMRNNFPVDQYECTGAFDLIRANQNVNIALNNLNTMIYFQAHDQMVISGAQPEDVKRIKIGSTDPIVVGASDVSVSLLNFDPKIVDSIEAIRFNIESIGYVYNLKIGWSIEGSPASGFSLLVQNIDLSESREDDVEIMKMHEIDMYRVLLAMQEYYQRFKMLGDEPKLPDGDLVTDFAESLQLPVNQDDEIKMKEFELSHNVISEVDLIQDNNPDMTEDEALERLQRNKKGVVIEEE